MNMAIRKNGDVAAPGESAQGMGQAATGEVARAAETFGRPA
jgi:hypothetical protein